MTRRAPTVNPCSGEVRGNGVAKGIGEALRSRSAPRVGGRHHAPDLIVVVPDSVLRRRCRGDVLGYEYMPDGAATQNVVLHGEGVSKVKAIHPNSGSNG
ncbi:MAG: hypothetical protein SFY68_07930 [Candidatus Sumerlaeia bacterium]|nr:hypothetical protein [Candidatus Sumerlaeia bacterium]